MKHVFNVLCLVVLAATMSLVSCSKDEPSTSNQNFEVNTKAAPVETATVIVQFFGHVTETRKAEIREEYVKDGVLLGWEPCEFPDKEKWTVPCVLCSRDSDVPVRTDPCEDEEPDETKAATDDTDECDIKRAYWGDECDE